LEKNKFIIYIMKERCESCFKKIKTLLPFKCKCDKYFCNLHRYPEHLCNFNYKKENKEKLTIKNPKIIADKLKYNIY
jgi:hypothetical protein